MAKNEKDKQTTAHMTQHRKLKKKQHEPHQKTRGDLRCSGSVSRSCSTCGTNRVAYVITNPTIKIITKMRLAIILILLTLVASGYARFFFYRRPYYRRSYYPSYRSYNYYGGSNNYYKDAGDRNEIWSDA
ncbi:uncharacterized protein LOC143068195 [Mytilus galloprovincialis]|uniref:uncharacterized protein LOC143068195 n=1 Tax=Mytilus galloprovincialis TaxID=29158 RepID=UPI003F7C04F7